MSSVFISSSAYLLDGDNGILATDTAVCFHSFPILQKETYTLSWSQASLVTSVLLGTEEAL